MSRRAIVLGVILFTLLSSLAAAADQQWTYKDLIGHRDRWPAEVTLKSDFKKRKTELHKGEKYPIFDVTRAGVLLDLGADKPPFPIPPDACDIVEAANAKTPGGPVAPRAIDEAAVLNDASLWPATIKITRAKRITNPQGQSLDLPAGTVCKLINFDEEGVLCVTENGDALRLRFADTDLLDAARECATVELEKRSSRIIDGVRDLLVDANGQPFVPPALDETKVFVFYYGASWCQPCLLTSPHIVKWVKANAASNPRMTVAMLSGDDKERDMLAYMKQGKMPWPAMKKSDMMKTPFFNYMARGSYPQILVTDRWGKVLYNGFDVSPELIQRHLNALDKVAASGMAK